MLTARYVRGRAIALLITPTNLVTAAGLLTLVSGLCLVSIGIWPVVNGAPMDDEDIINMILGLLIVGWGVLVCCAASRMRDLSSRRWAMAGAALSVPMLVGLYALFVLMTPKVKAGFTAVAADRSRSE
jgi:hypothetical protein